MFAHVNFVFLYVSHFSHGRLNSDECNLTLCFSDLKCVFCHCVPRVNFFEHGNLSSISSETTPKMDPVIDLFL